MSKFTGTLKIEELVPGKRWRLLEPIQYESGAKGSAQWVIVPADFETDGATIPPFLRVFLAVWGTYGRAACLHDYGYNRLLNNMPHPNLPTRAACDREFRIAMLACGTRPWLAWMMWAAVRCCGWIYFRRET